MAKDKPTVFSLPDSRWWWLSWFTDEGRLKQSLRPLNLSIESHTKEQALRIALEHFGLSEASQITEEGETLDWLRTYILNILRIEQKRASTTKEYTIAIEHLIRIYGAEYPMRAIKKADWINIQNNLLEKGDKPPTVNKIGRHLNGAFSRLVENEIIDKNPFAKFRRITETRDDSNYLSRDELKAFLAVSDKANNNYAKLAQVLALTGRRLTEILYLNRSEIDLPGNRMLVMNVKDRNRTKKWLTFPNPVTFEVNKKSFRISVRENIEWLLNCNHREAFAVVCKPRTLYDHIKVWLKEIGRGELCAHDLRHTFITLAGETTELWRVQKMVDHSSITVTEGYFHQTAEDMESVDLGLNGK